MFHRDASAMSYIVLQMHSSTADNVIYWKLCLWLPKTFVWCVMGVIRQRGKNTPWTVYLYHIYIYIIPLWHPQGNHYITWDEYLMIFDNLIEELSFLWSTNIAENAYISDIENTARDVSTCIVILWHCKYIQYVTIIPPLPHGLIESFKIVNNDFTFGSTTLFPCGPSPSLGFSIIHFLPWQQSIYSL